MRKLEQLKDHFTRIAHKYMTIPYLSIIKDAVTDGVLILTPKGEIIDYNLAAEKIFGILPASITVLDHADNSVSIIKVLKTVVRKSPTDFYYNWSRYHQDMIQTRVKLIKHSQRFGGYIVAIITDLSREKVLEAALYQTEQMYYKLLENAPISIIIHSEGYILYANRQAVNVLAGKNREDIEGREVLSFIPTSYQHLITQRIKTVYQKKQDLEIINEQFIRLDQKIIDVEVMAIRVDYKGRPASEVIFQDITLKKQREQQLLQAQKMEIVGNLAGGVAHDFNNLLGAISGAVSLIRFQQKDITQEELSSLLSIIGHSSSRAEQLVQQLLSISRKSIPSLEQINLTYSLNHVARLCETMLDKSINFSVHNKLKKAIVTADPAQIEQALLNVCINAAHAMTIMRPMTDQIGGVLTLALESFTVDQFFRSKYPRATEDHYWQLSIKDTGVGISPKNLKTIFDPFFSTKKEQGGTGLGLAMVYRIVQQHNGFLTVYSEEGKGSHFHLFFPKSESERSRDDLKEQPFTLFSGSGTILIVDDEEMLLEITSGMVTAMGFSTITTKDGATAIKLFKQHQKKIKLVILDMAMPGLSGGDVLKRLKLIDPEVKILLVSGFKQDDRLIELLDQDVTAFLQKPFSLQKLSQKLVKLL